jgi:hypothetical protein
MGLAFDVELARLGRERVLVQILKVWMEESPPGRDPLGRVVDQHLKLDYPDI